MEGHLTAASAGVLDSQSVKTATSSGLGMVRYGGINRLNPYLARDLID